jgi:hypothetical protein
MYLHHRTMKYNSLVHVKLPIDSNENPLIPILTNNVFMCKLDDDMNLVKIDMYKLQ